MTERSRRSESGLVQMDIMDITTEDSKAYTQPFAIRVGYRLVPDIEPMQFACAERHAIHDTAREEGVNEKGLCNIK